MNALTVCAPQAQQTEQTEQTYSITNNDFLTAIYRDLPGNVAPMIVSFAGNPNNASGGAWAASAWHHDTVELPAEHNNYFSVSAFSADDDGSYRRRKANFHSCYCIMLDDIGTKADAEGLLVEPSWVIETSEGNFQAGYIFKEPIQEASEADQVLDAIIAAGLCDPGANGAAARLARLPVATNNKYEPAFSCRLTKWRPDLRYTVAELVSGLNLTLTIVNKKSAGRVSQQKHTHRATGNDVWTPRPATNPLLTDLRNLGLVKAPISEGKYDITCPWVDEHTNAVDSGTAYFEPNNDYPLGGFSCLHGHCASRSIRDLLDLLRINEFSARLKAIIYVREGEIDRVVDAAEQILAEAGGYYQSRGSVVRVNLDPSLQEPSISRLGADTLTMDLARIAVWLRFDLRKQNWVSKDPNEKYIRTLLNKQHYGHLPVLKGIARQPYIREDSGLVRLAGYDSETQMYGAFDPAEFNVPESPTQEEACAALEVLHGVLEEFQFASDADKSAALCAILTAAIRPSLAAAMMFLVNANMPGTGKSYLCATITSFASPTQGQPLAFPRDDGECSKLLFAELRNAPSVVEFDNLTSDLVPHKSLCTAITSETMTGRVLSLSETATVSTRALFLASGNNIEPAADMVRRCLTIKLTCKEENPAQREFKHPDLLQDIKRDRGRYVSAALTIIRAWVAAGEPKQQLKPLAGFEHWSKMCRQPLVWLGLPDPATNVFDNMANDPERDQLARLFALWGAKFGIKPMRVRDVIKRLGAPGSNGQALTELLEDIAGDYRGGINPRSLGKWLASKRGRVVDGKQLVRVRSSSNGDTWAVC